MVIPLLGSKARFILNANANAKWILVTQQSVRAPFHFVTQWNSHRTEHSQEVWTGLKLAKNNLGIVFGVFVFVPSKIDPSVKPKVGWQWRSKFPTAFPGFCSFWVSSEGVVNMAILYWLGKTVNSPSNLLHDCRQTFYVYFVCIFLIRSQWV